MSILRVQQEEEEEEEEGEVVLVVTATVASVDSEVITWDVLSASLSFCLFRSDG